MNSKRIITEQIKGFGSNLKRQRTQTQITQEKLAELADLNIRTIQKIEAGETNILITTALRLQQALHCPWEDLMKFK